MDTTKLLNLVEQPYLRKNVPGFRPGDTVRVWTKIVEGDTQRLQPFEGTIIRRRGSGMKETFSIRKLSYGVGIERTFNISSPMIDKIELLKHGKVRRAKLYYLRKTSGRASKIDTIDVVNTQTNAGTENTEAETGQPK